MDAKRIAVDSKFQTLVGQINTCLESLDTTVAEQKRQFELTVFTPLIAYWSLTHVRVGGHIDFFLRETPYLNSCLTFDVVLDDVR